MVPATQETVGETSNGRRAELITPDKGIMTLRVGGELYVYFSKTLTDLSGGDPACVIQRGDDLLIVKAGLNTDASFRVRCRDNAASADRYFIVIPIKHIGLRIPETDGPLRYCKGNVETGVATTFSPEEGEVRAVLLKNAMPILAAHLVDFKVNNKVPSAPSVTRAKTATGLICHSKEGSIRFRFPSYRGVGTSLHVTVDGDDVVISTQPDEDEYMYSGRSEKSAKGDYHTSFSVALGVLLGNRIKYRKAFAVKGTVRTVSESHNGFPGVRLLGGGKIIQGWASTKTPADTVSYTLPYVAKVKKGTPVPADIVITRKTAQDSEYRENLNCATSDLTALLRAVNAKRENDVEFYIKANGDVGGRRLTIIEL